MGNGEGVSGNGFTRHAFYRSHRVGVGRMVEGNGLSCASCPAGPSDSVYIIFGGLREVIVDDVGNALDVETTGCHIRCNQNLEVTFSELGENPIPDMLRLVPMEGVGRVAFPTQGDGELFRSALGSGEDNGLSCVILDRVQDCFQDAQFLGSVGNCDNLLFDLGG